MYIAYAMCIVQQHWWSIAHEITFLSIHFQYSGKRASLLSPWAGSLGLWVKVKLGFHSSRDGAMQTEEKYCL